MSDSDPRPGSGEPPAPGEPPEAAPPDGETPETPPPETEKERDWRVWKNVSALVGGNLVGELLGSVVQIMMMKILGPAGIGRYSQAVAVTDVADGVGALGMNQVGPVLGVNYLDRLGKYLGTVLTLRMTASLLVIAGVFFLAPWLLAENPIYVRLAVCALFFTPLGNVATIPFFLKQENIHVSWVPGATAIINMILLSGVLFSQPRVEYVIVAFMVSKAFHAFTVSEVARRRYRFKYGYDWQIMKRLLRVGPKAGWLDVVVLTYSRASYLVLDSLGAAMVGVYAVADRVVGPALRVTGALSASSLPMFSELAAAGKSRELVGFYLRNLKRIGLGLGAIGLAVFMVIPPVLEHFFPRYVGSIPVLYVLYMGLGFMAVNQMTTSCLNGMGHFGWVAAVATINLGLYFIGAWLWVDTYQATGAAMATSFMEGCNMFMQIGLLMIALRLKNRELEREKR